MIIAVEMGHQLDECERALAQLKPVPGRLEVIKDKVEGQPTVAIDFVLDDLETLPCGVRQVTTEPSRCQHHSPACPY